MQGTYLPIGALPSSLHLAEAHIHRATANTTPRGPEVETWIGVDDGSDPAADNDWPLLPFMALSDGAHAYASPPTLYQ